jgi:purine-binding chemotaxis protein CheW
MGEAAAAPEAERLRFLTFRVDERLYAVAADHVVEVIHTPQVAHVPQGPKSLLGLANLRGSVLPIATARGLLGKAEREAAATDRTIVLGGGVATGVAVDGIEGLVSVEPTRVETRQAELTAEPGEELTGAFQPEGRTEVARILDLRGLLASAFRPRERPHRQRSSGAVMASGDVVPTHDEGQRLVAFEVAGQEYALPLDAVREIIPTPPDITSVPHGEALLLGVVAYRDTLLPLLALRGLLGFRAAAPGDESKVLVTRVGAVLVGLVADRTREILSAPPHLVDLAPPMLAARAGGEARVEAIYRGDGGRRLVSILAPSKLFREDIMARLGDVAEPRASSDSQVSTAAQGQYVVFRLGDDEFALPIEAVQEVTRAPAKVSRVPKTPKFLEGVINLRGEVLPVVDQRRRFDMPPAADLESRRLIVLQTERHRAGVIVDSVSEVLRCAPDDIEEAPDLTGEATRLVTGVINLEAAGRMVLLLDPAELLTRTERSLLDAFKPEADKADA